MLFSPASPPPDSSYAGCPPPRLCIRNARARHFPRPSLPVGDWCVQYVKVASGGLLTLEQVCRIAGGSVAMWCGVRDDGTPVLSCGAGAAGGVCGPV
jgi:hypothetical protein